MYRVIFPEIIKLGLEHLENCFALDQKALNGLWSKRQWEKELKDPKRICIGLLGSSKLLGIGTGWLVIDELQITAIAVDPKHRNKGLAKKILHGLIDEAESKGATHASLEVASDNIAGKTLYQSFGFKTTGLRKGYYINGSDALLQSLTFK